MGIVLSHTTARAVYQTAYSVATSATETVTPVKTLDAIPRASQVASAIEWLSKHGVDINGERLEALVSSDRHRRATQNCSCHVAQHSIDSSEIYELAPDLYIVSVEQCALQAATYLPFCELVEYYFELCGAYALNPDDPTDYSTRPALTSTVKLKRYFESSKHQHGIEAARKAIQFVRDGCRSPMETAFVMTLTLPRRMGGLGIREVETDYEVKVGKIARELTRRTKFYFDAYLRRSRTDIEYNGFYHDSEENRAIDEERKNALRTMGYEIVTVSRHSFFDKGAFARVMLSIIRREGIRPSRLTKDFFVKQEKLRQFVLRRYIEKMRLEEEARQAIQREQAKAAQENALAMGIADDPSINEAPEFSDMQQITPFEESLDCEGTAFGSITSSHN